MCGWPRSLFDWDILFLLPLPWWGPVLAPVTIAVLMIAWGTYVSLFPQARRTGSSVWIAWSTTFAGIAIALYVFMADALHHVYQRHTVSTQVLPTEFNWALFCVALLLMAAPCQPRPACSHPGDVSRACRSRKSIERRAVGWLAPVIPPPPQRCKEFRRRNTMAR